MLSEETKGRACRDAPRVDDKLFGLLEALPVYAAVLMPDYRISFANHEFRTRFGDPRDRRCFEHLLTRAEPCEGCQAAAVLETAASRHWDWQGPDQRAYEVYGLPFRATDGTACVVEMGIDVTERTRAEAELHRYQANLEHLVAERTATIEDSNAQLLAEIAERERVERALVRAKEEWERTFDSVPDLIAIIDNDYRVQRVNKAMADRFGIAVERFVGQRCYEAAHGTCGPPDACPLTRTLRDGREHVSEVHEEHLGGDFVVSTTPLLDERGTMLGSVHVARDITQRKRAEQALIEAQREQERSLAELHAVLDHLHEGLVIADLEGRLFHWNPAAIAMHGFGSMDECRRALPDFADTFELSTPEEGILPLDRWPLARILRGETLREWKVTVRRLDGRWTRVFLYGGALARDSAGAHLLAVVSIRDVTEQERAAQALREGREDLNRAQAVASTGSWRLDVRRNELLWSDETYRMFGVPIGTALNYEAFLEAVHPEDRALVERQWEAALRGAPYDIEHRITVGEAVRWVRERAELEIAADGTLCGGFGTVQDVTERKLAEAALQHAHDTLEQRVRERTDDLRRANETLRMISDCNQALVRTTTEDELVREVCRIIQGRGRFLMAWVGYAQDDPERTVRPVAWAGLEDRYLTQTRMSWADDEHGRGPTGTCIRSGRPCVGGDFVSDPELAPWKSAAVQRGFRSSIALPLIGGGRAFGALMLYSGEANAFDERQPGLLMELADDLAFGILARRAAIERDHARREAEDRAVQLRHLTVDLARVEQRERRRIAGVLHDHVQQLLVGAQYNLASVQGRRTAKERQQALRDVTRILDEATAATSTLTAELSPPTLHEKGLVSGLEWLGRQMRQKHGLRVQVRADPATEPSSEQLRYLLFEAVRELLFNVVKHAGVSRARVGLTRPSADEVRVVVEDEGSGFDPALVDSGERATGGFGLLSIRERLGCVGGYMSIESQPGQGSRFTLSAPASLHRSTAEGSVTDPSGSSLPTPSRTNGSEPLRVLLADDHAVMREGLRRLLADQPGIEVVGEASDGQMAVDLALRLRPAVVLMDVSMPHVNGIEATARILAENAEVRIIGLSMHEEGEMATAMREAGAVAYLTKNGPPVRIVAAIRAAAAARSPQSEPSTRPPEPTRTPRPGNRSKARTARRSTPLKPAAGRPPKRSRKRTG